MKLKNNLSIVKVITRYLLLSLFFVAYMNQKYQTAWQEQTIADEESASPFAIAEKTDSAEEKWLKDALEDISDKYFVVSMQTMRDNRLVICSQNGKRIHLDLLEIPQKKIYSQNLDKEISGVDEINVAGTNIIFYDQNNHVVILDRTLHIANIITIPPKYVEPLGRNYCVLPKKRKIIYYIDEADNSGWYHSLYSCNFKGKKNKRILRMDAPETNIGYINSFKSICGSLDEKVIYFCGCYLDSAASGTESKPCIGTVDLQTGKLKVYKESKEFTRLTSEGMLYYDGWCEPADRTGYFTILSPTGKKKDVQVAGKAECQQIFPSDKANYFFSVQTEDTDYDDIDDTTVVRCYNSQGGKVFWSKKETTLLEQMCYLEDSDRLIYFYYTSDAKCSFKVLNGNEVKENPFDLDEIASGNQRIDAAFSFGVANYDIEKQVIPYDGGMLNIEFSIETEKSVFECGVMIFIDGIAQKYRQQKDGDEAYLWSVAVDGQDTQIHTYLKPKFAQNKKKHSIQFACMFEPEFRTSGDSPGFGNYHKISKLPPWQLICHEKQEIELEKPSSADTVSISEKVRKQYREEKMDGTIRDRLKEQMQMCFLSDEEEQTAYPVKSPITFRIMGGARCTYRLSAYVDHKLVPVFNGKDYVDVTVDKDRMYQQVFDLSTLDEVENYSCFYVIACPLTNLNVDDFAVIGKSNSIALRKGEE